MEAQGSAVGIGQGQGIATFAPPRGVWIVGLKQAAAQRDHLAQHRVHEGRWSWVHLLLGPFDGVIDDRVSDELGCTSSQFLRRHWDGVLVANGAYTPQRAQESVAAGACELVSFGRSFIANPDLVERLREGRPLVDYRPEMTKALE